MNSRQTYSPKGLNYGSGSPEGLGYGAAALKGWTTGRRSIGFGMEAPHSPRSAW